MSGTSLDGLDIAYCVFKKDNDGWRFSVEKAITTKYPSSWLQKLSNAHLLPAVELAALDVEYGKLLGDLCLRFIRKHKITADFIASHGHTVFHRPKRRFTYQLGNGNALHASAGLPVIYDFRSLDVARGGEGAPLVPAGDEILFSDYDVCLNLGGIANLSRNEKGKRIAFDICFANMGLNYLAGQLNKPYDHNGDAASAGEINPAMLRDLRNAYKRFKFKRPSLGRELFEQTFKPILDTKKITIYDKLRTLTESTAEEIVEAFQLTKKPVNVLCTGGGAFNSFLISTILDKSEDKAALVLPDDEIIKFKEAIVFAFLGVLRKRNEVNCLKNVTGASSDSSAGLIIGF